MTAPLNILLIEDNEGDVYAIRRALRNDKSSYELWVVNDGIQALDFLCRRAPFADVPAPEIILLDINLPRMNGKTFLEKVKNDPQLQAIPVVVLTSAWSRTEIRECYERHASCYVVKPFDGKEFENTLRQIVNFWCDIAELP